MSDAPDMTPDSPETCEARSTPRVGSAHPVGAVVCCDCGCAGRTDEMVYHNHGDGVEGWTCGECQARMSETVADMYQRFLKRCDELKAESAGSGKDAQNRII